MTIVAPQVRMETDALLSALEGVTAIPVVPYRNGQIDFDGHRKNVRYLMSHNALDGGRPRVISIAGTSPVHHMTLDEQVKLVDATTQTMGSEGVYVAGVVPNPLADARKLIGELSALQRPPDAYLIMPLGGIYDPEGLYQTFRDFGDEMADAHGARFIYYFKQSRDLDAVARLFADSDAFIGVKVGTGEEDVHPLVREVGDNGLIIWGIGDRSTRGAELGAKGHTSGIGLLAARLSDEINNAQRRGDYRTSAQLQAKADALETIRFRNGRIYNYSAVVEAMILSGFDDIDGGEGAPFNPRVPEDIAYEVEEAIKPLIEFH
ncbi:MAG: dihydrodipicolinate synthase family protein [Caldilineaceae bacterium]|nr:dihydrodipicolinate synthase family protein [Caldilineaceae bacterium]